MCSANSKIKSKNLKLFVVYCLWFSVCLVLELIELIEPLPAGRQVPNLLNICFFEFLFFNF